MADQADLKMSQKWKAILKKIIGEDTLRRIRASLNQRKISKMGMMYREPFDRHAFSRGINLVGMFAQDSGLGQSCRLLAKEIKKTGSPYHFINHFNYSHLRVTNHEFDKELSNDFSYGINIFHENMHEFFLTYYQLGKEKWDKHYNIAFWLWEMQEFPEEWVPMINQLDEIWTPAEFVSNAVRKVTDKPVYTIPYAMEAPYDEKFDRDYFSLPKDKFLYLMLFDRNSIAERKNPDGIIKAFKKAFSANDSSVGLVVKITNENESELEEIKEQLNGYNVYFVRGVLEKIKLNSLIKCVDVYVSLHRAEGFGLVLAEAMLLKTATIATNYSANTEFQDHNTACLVDYKLIPVGKSMYPYKKNDLWADPDINHAAMYMRKLYNDPEYKAEIEKKAYDKMSSDDTILLPSKLIAERVREIYENI